MKASPGTLASTPSEPHGGQDPELDALPRPRRPGRTATLVMMGLTTLLSLLLAFSLRSEGSYALRAGAPLELGPLAAQAPQAEWGNRWVRAEGSLAPSGAIKYGRLLEADGFRLARLEGTQPIWVEVRVPKGMEGPYFVPPTSFVGRLVPFASAGLRHASLTTELQRATGTAVPQEAWLLVDGESPAQARWVLGIVGMMLAFALFGIVGLLRLLRPISDD